METFIQQLRQDFPALQFAAADLPSWSPRQQLVSYPRSHQSDVDFWSTLHEVGHALLQHTTYESDIRLLQMEVAAWDKALALAQQYGLTISDEHVQSCLDTYRDWLHKRSACPACEAHGLQRSQTLYGCFNCQTTWSVSSERFCRPYRLKMSV